MLDYNQVDPDSYENRSSYSSRELYLKQYWDPVICDYIDRYCKDKVVVDLGCGTGTYTRSIARNSDRILGVDISINMLQYAMLHNKSNYVQACATQLAIRSESVDVVICIGLLEYVDPVDLIKEISRILKRDGICIIQCPNKYSAMRAIGKISYKLLNKDYPHHERSNKEICTMIRDQGLKILVNKMDDGLVWLPKSVDRLIGMKVYSGIDKLMRIARRNPFSNIMLLIVEK
jgi:2-polyprenyl-3-methyl-5-hydroxy-6-metoxy-1,4-benzoquinol methylase